MWAIVTVQDVLFKLAFIAFCTVLPWSYPQFLAFWLTFPLPHIWTLFDVTLLPPRTPVTPPSPHTPTPPPHPTHTPHTATPHTHPTTPHPTYLYCSLWFWADRHIPTTIYVHLETHAVPTCLVGHLVQPVTYSCVGLAFHCHPFWDSGHCPTPIPHLPHPPPAPHPTPTCPQPTLPALQPPTLDPMPPPLLRCVAWCCRYLPIYPRVTGPSAQHLAHYHCIYAATMPAAFTCLYRATPPACHLSHYTAPSWRLNASPRTRTTHHVPPPGSRCLIPHPVCWRCWLDPVSLPLQHVCACLCASHLLFFLCPHTTHTHHTPRATPHFMVVGWFCLLCLPHTNYPTVPPTHPTSHVPRCPTRLLPLPPTPCTAHVADICCCHSPAAGPCCTFFTTFTTHGCITIVPLVVTFVRIIALLDTPPPLHTHARCCLRTTACSSATLCRTHLCGFAGFRYIQVG